MSLIARSRGQEAELDDAAAEDALEAVFSEIVASSSAEPQPSTLSEPGTKKSRAEILAQLKASRSGSGATIKTEGDSSQTSESVASSKFKPIGFKPIGAPEGKKKKKKRVDGAPEGDGESKKKKRKVVIAEAPTTKANSAPSESKITSNAVPASDSAIDDEEDIFADAGEYQGVDLGDSDEEGDTGDLVTSNGVAETTSDQPSVMRRGWFEGEPTPPPTTHTVPVAEMEEGETLDVPSTGDMEAEEPPMRLQPLASSALPSVRDMLAADEALEKEEKRRERKEKRKKA
jgi:IK cytokine